MSEAIKQIVSEFEKPVIEIPSDIMDAIQCSRLGLITKYTRSANARIKRKPTCMYPGKFFFRYWFTRCKKEFSMFWYCRGVPE